MRCLVAILAVAVVGAAACAGAKTPTSPTPSAPAITSLSPTSGGPGTAVTIRGSRFAPTGTHVKFGDGYLKNLTSADGVTLRFVVPDGLDLCAPGATGPCPGSYPRVMPGDYAVAVLAGNVASNSVTFRVAEH